MRAGSCRLRMEGCDRRRRLGDTGDSPAAGHRPGAQCCNRRHLSSSWTAASGSLRWSQGSWSWGFPWAEEAAEGGSGAKVEGLVSRGDLGLVGRMKKVYDLWVKREKQ